LIFIQGEKQGSSFSLLRVNIHFTQHHLLKGLSSLQWPFWHLCWQSDDCICVDLFLGLIFYWSVCLFLCQYHAIFVTMTL
jgi:hypothetical protein